MFNTHRLIGSVFVLGLFSTALAQENRAPLDNPQEPVATVPTGPLVTAAATAKRVRFVSPSTVVQLRLEVYNEAGQKLFDTQLHGGNVLDWHLQDGAGERLAAGSYACVLTTKSMSGRLSQRVGLVTVTEKKATIKTAGADHLSLAQQQTIGPVEGQGALTVLQESEEKAITAVTHNGLEGQLTSTTGALTFRTGDIFAAKDKEQMRITEDGRVGIGTAKPEATLDVAGAVRVSEGIKFSDGTTLQAASGQLQVRDAAGELVAAPSAAGTGTINRLAKWSETGGAGALIDAAGAEVSGLTIFGQNASGQVAPLFPTAPTAHVLEVGATGTRTPLTLAGGSGVMEFWKDLGGGTGAPAAAVSFGMAQPGLAATNDMVFSTYTPAAFWNERMRLTTTGDLGIGNANPQAKLDVTGNINTSTQYNIGSSRVLSIPGTENTFVGVNTGLNINPMFTAWNTFVGHSAGQANTSGNQNSFFGRSAGQSTQGGFRNSFFGTLAGNANEDGDENSFFGNEAGERSTSNQSSFFGAYAGQGPVSGPTNSGFGNSFFGAFAG